MEGFDGAGKTVLCKVLRQKLIDMGENVLYVREPGGVPRRHDMCNLIRKTLTGEGIIPDVKAGLLLFAASMRENLVKNIIPAVDKGRFVICDRGFESMLAYQCAGDDIDKGFILDLRKFIFEDYEHSKIFYLSGNPSLFFKRIANRGERSPCVEKSRRIINAYEKMFANDKEERFVKLDASINSEYLADIIIKEMSIQ